jgi:hypothetical protein
MAQNEDAAMNEDTALIGLGTVSLATPQQLVVKEYDYETDADQDVTYAITDKTEFENLKTIMDLKAGDSVEVVYAEADGKKVALSISKEDDYIEDEGEENTPAATNAEEANGTSLQETTPGGSATPSGNTN